MGVPLKGRSGRFSRAKSVAPPGYRKPEQTAHKLVTANVEYTFK